MGYLVAASDLLGGLLKPEIIWALVGLGLLILEFMLPGLIVFFFGLGAIVTAAVCLLTDITLNTQLLIFTLSSVALLVCLRQVLKRLFVGYSSGDDGMGGSQTEHLGERAVVKERIEPTRPGKVEFHGTDWTAESEHSIEPGAPVEIIAQKNLVFKVKPL